MSPAPTGALDTAAAASEEVRRLVRVRDDAIRQAIAEGASLREVGDAVGMTHVGVMRVRDRG